MHTHVHERARTHAHARTNAHTSIKKVTNSGKTCGVQMQTFLLEIHIKQKKNNAVITFKPISKC